MFDEMLRPVGRRRGTFRNCADGLDYGAAVFRRAAPARSRGEPAPTASPRLIPPVYVSPREANGFRDTVCVEPCSAWRTTTHEELETRYEASGHFDRSRRWHRSGCCWHL